MFPEIETTICTNAFPLEYKLLEFRMRLNKELYDERIIDLEVFREMEQSLLGRMTKIKKESSI